MSILEPVFCFLFFFSLFLYFFFLSQEQISGKLSRVLQNQAEFCIREQASGSMKRALWQVWGF